MSSYTAEWRRLVAEAIANGARCVDCGTDRDLEGDHDLPVSKGGLSTRANLAIRCRRHNGAKGNRVTRYQLRVPWPYEPPEGAPSAADERGRHLSLHLVFRERQSRVTEEGA
jgi:5-methylcytosine-specific restriction endonuclease McrA